MPRDRTRRRGHRAPKGLSQLPWRRLVNPYRPIEVLNEDQVEAIHLASLRLLEETGMEVLSNQALDALSGAGAEVDHANRRVRFDHGLVEEAVGRAPRAFTLHPRNPARSVTLGANHVNFSSVSGPPNCSDLDRGRRPGSYPDFCNLLRLIQSLNVLHLAGGMPVAPIDLEPQTRHLDCCYAFITLTDRAWNALGLGAYRVDDAIEMLCLARGVDRDRLAREPGIMSVINTNSPLRLDGPMAEGLMAMARAGQPVIVTPFTLAGAMSPVTLAGALAQQNAEALAGITLAEVVSPGAPVVYGGFTSNVDMKSGAPAFGTPEYTKAALAGGQLARRYRLPFRSSNVNAANLVDAQAAYESEMSVWGAVMAHANLVLHGAGWLEGGLTASFEKMVIDAEILQMMAEFLRPIEV
ncbi:MAG: trimethylamine methyltransferase family protein, partial [Alphaproteobacteria bacterium]